MCRTGDQNLGLRGAPYGCAPRPPRTLLIEAYGHRLEAA